MGGIYPTGPTGEMVHSPSAVSSNATAVPLSAAPLWVEQLRIQIDDDNPAGQKALFGDATLSPSSYGLHYYAGDQFDWPFRGPIPVHQIHYYQVGGAGEVRWIGLKRKGT